MPSTSAAVAFPKGVSPRAAAAMEAAYDASDNEGVRQGHHEAGWVLGRDLVSLREEVGPHILGGVVQAPAHAARL